MSLPLNEVVDVQFSKSNGGKGFTPEVPLKGIWASKYLYELLSNDGRVLMGVMYDPADATNKLMHWVTSNAAVVTVDADGYVTPVAAGEAFVTGTADDGGYTVVIKFVITKAPVPVTDVTVSPTTLSLEVGATGQLSYTYLPADADDLTFSWESDDTTIATVDSTGKVTGIAPGSTIVTINYSADVFDTCDVTVKPPTVHVTSVEFTTQEPLNVNIGDTAPTAISVLPANATDKSVSYTSSAPSIATVDSSGVVTGVAAGNATITVTTTDGGKTDTLAVVVKVPVVPVTGVTIDEGSTASMTVGDTLQLHATVAPANATNKTVSWQSSATAIATVSSAGLVTAIAGGSANITVTTQDGSFTATIGISIDTPVVHPDSVAIDQGDTATVIKGETLQLTATVLPADATNKAVSWSSATPAAATVDSNGLVTAVDFGSSVITVTTEDGAKTDTITITVPSPASLRTDSFPSNLLVGNKVQLTYTTDPANSPLTDIAYSSSDESIATVDSTGLVTMLAEGSATISMSAKSYGEAVSDGSGMYPVTMSVHTDSLPDLAVGATQSLVVTTTPEWVLTDSASTVQYTTTDDTIATVDNTGLITGVASGGCRIGATVTNGLVSESDSSYQSVG
ncbi:major tail protein [Salmonella phage SE4]|uniref:major tail protein n=1 Tax=Salmonella phage SE4 TaxID=2575328 RepID=UPI0011D2E8A2|nr:major tail protein [Salmonella phage SE4]QEG07775.1 major tail protein [Salmonella phage SE4]